VRRASGMIIPTEKKKEVMHGKASKFGRKGEVLG
jgi:hypothetical protein